MGQGKTGRKKKKKNVSRSAFLTHWRRRCGHATVYAREQVVPGSCSRILYRAGQLVMEEMLERENQLPTV